MSGAHFPLPSAFSIAIILIAIVAEAGFAGLLPLSLGFFIDRLATSHDGRVLYLWAGIVAGTAVLAAALGILRDFVWARTQSATLGRVRQAAFERLQRISMRLHSPRRDAELLDPLSSDLTAIEQALVPVLPWGALPLAQAFLSVGLMVWLDWRAGLTGLLLAAWIILAPKVQNRVPSEDEKQVAGAMRENLAAQAVIRAFSLEQFLAARFRTKNNQLASQMASAHFFGALHERFTSSGFAFIQVVLLVVDARLIIHKEMSIGAAVALQILVLTLGNSLLSVVQYLPVVASAKSAWGRVQKIIMAPDAVAERREARFLPPLQKEILFSHVDFSYDGHDRHLVDVTLRIPAGTYAAFVGASGSGKSTLLNLLLRLQDPSGGLIAIDGHDLRSVTLASLRSRIGVVLQENSLFNISVLENIRIGKPDASEEGIVYASMLAGLHDFITTLPDGYQTVHPTLTAGAMQRLAIARAILRDPEVLLLDEATSALDPMEEAAVRKTLRQIGQGRTVISATHRLSTAADADHIFVFDRGSIVEQGSHYELLAADGLYAELWRKQAGFTFSADGAHVDVDAHRLKAFPILGNLDEQKLSELAPVFATETFQPGREIVRQNDPGDKFYIIARGKVEVWRTEEQSGITKRMAVLQDGDYFGEITLITGFPRTATVRASTVCTCISLGRGQFNRMMERFPELRQQLSEEAIRRLRESSKAMSVPI